MVDLTVSVVTSNNEKLAVDCLNSIYSTVRGITFEICVVVNASSDDTEATLRERFPHAHLLVNTETKGFTHNHNAVMRRAKGRYFLILNDDTVILKDALTAMVRYMDRHPRVGVLGCRILNADGSFQWSCGKSSRHIYEYFRSGVLKPLFPWVKELHPKTIQEVSWVTGACLIARASAAAQVGLFDENIVIYFEDSDWCYRMLRAGWKVVFYPDATIIHYHGQTRKKNMARDNFFIYSSKLYFFKKHSDVFTLLAVRTLTFVEALLRYCRFVIAGTKSRDEKLALMRTYKRVMALAVTNGR